MKLLRHIHQLRREVVISALHAGNLLSVRGDYRQGEVPRRQIGRGRHHGFAQISQAALPPHARQIGPQVTSTHAHDMALATAAFAPEYFLARGSLSFWRYP